MDKEAICPAGWLGRQVRLAPDGLALSYPGGELTFAALGERVRQLAQECYAQGVRAGDALALRVTDQLTALLYLFAALELDAAVFPLDPRMPFSLYEGLLAEAGVDWRLEREGEGWRLQRHCAPDPRRPLPPGEERIALLLATSGSSGRPRVVMLTQANLAAGVRASRQRNGLKAGDSWLACLPMFHVGGLAIGLRCVEAGARLVIHQGFDARLLWQTLNQQPITQLSLVPSMLGRLLTEAGGAGPPATLRLLLVGGAALHEGLLAQARGWPLRQTWGMTECASQVATAMAGEGAQPGCVGPPLEGCRIEREPDTGRLWVSGPMVMAGYANALRTPGDGLDGRRRFATSDWGYVTAEGDWVIGGRLDRVVNSGGEKVAPELVEGVLLAHPEVQQAVAMGVADRHWGERLVCAYVGAVAEDELAAWLGSRLAGPWRPKQILRCAAWPLLANGKPDYLELGRWLADAK